MRSTSYGYKKSKVEKRNYMLTWKAMIFVSAGSYSLSLDRLKKIIIRVGTVLYFLENCLGIS